MRRFDGKVALVTGASRGIGKACAARLVAEGARVCLTARRPEPLAEVVAELGGPRHALAVAGHADDEAHRAEAVARTVEAFGGIDVLVNNTAVNPAYGPVLAMEADAVRKVFDVNVHAALDLIRRVRESDPSREGRAVVNVTALAGLRTAHGIGVYGASKAALIHLTAQLAREEGPGMRINSVAPAVIRTRFAAKLYEEQEEQLAKEYALGRLGTPEDVAAAVAFLASGDAAWVTGQTLAVDGGIILQGGGI
ncbi:short-chain dehydrogenase/reductase SDR [Streptomyces albus]|uniref:Short-chain dehydrogenase/reductase SDR n=1 Tax=Streptomyces albus (strain ATCC 21838 / DSM 41398 / FERM P-419 / JCM 4703 / NBRC 107858) TaxID=1081613 RepID=A0A0B5EQL6_STRA4|nr:short-chain dehydrogenase/reductase SDR [Streptomyces albus]AOU79370.1 short-chain dehydrogenase/reductase SDR [Streptomyces albus]